MGEKKGIYWDLELSAALRSVLASSIPQLWVLSSLLSILAIKATSQQMQRDFSINEVSQGGGGEGGQGLRLSSDWLGPSLRHFLMLLWLFWREKRAGRFQSHLKAQGVVSLGPSGRSAAVISLAWSSLRKCSWWFCRLLACSNKAKLETYWA